MGAPGRRVCGQAAMQRFYQAIRALLRPQLGASREPPSSCAGGYFQIASIILSHSASALTVTGTELRRDQLAFTFHGKTAPGRPPLGRSDGRCGDLMYLGSTHCGEHLRRPIARRTITNAASAQHIAEPLIWWFVRYATCPPRRGPRRLVKIAEGPR